MDINCEYVSYSSTGFFTPLTVDYINESEHLRSFFQYPVSALGIKEAIAARQHFPINREILVAELRNQYSGFTLTDRQVRNIDALLLDSTFTVTTAHQPVIFTGPLYFIYKIIHAIKLADLLNSEHPENTFVPVFYMGSEDADIDELGQLNLNGEKLLWTTDQTGAVGRMKVDQPLLQLIDAMAGQLGIHAHGKELIEIFRHAYKLGESIQQSTLHLINELFRNYGLLVVIPDSVPLKSQFTHIVTKELSEHFSHPIVADSIRQLSAHYKTQAVGRDINLFYLFDNVRERIERTSSKFVVKSLGKEWEPEAMLQEAQTFPERFSANVILRPLFQELILPNIIFIGGGGEIAYWLELKNLFKAAGIHYPLLVLRNSFLFWNNDQQKQLEKFGFVMPDLFKGYHLLINELVNRESNHQLQLTGEKQQMHQLYKILQELAGKIDSTLAAHAVGLQHKANEKIEALERKMLRAEKRKFEAHQRQLKKLLQQLFPTNGLQERVENFSMFYAKYGPDWLKTVYNCSLGLEQRFAMVGLKR